MVYFYGWISSMHPNFANLRGVRSRLHYLERQTGPAAVSCGPKAKYQSPFLERMERKEYETLYLELNVPVARFGLDRLEKLNAITRQMRRDRDDALDYQHDEQLDIKMLLVEGERQAFCFGADLIKATARFARATT